MDNVYLIVSHNTRIQCLLNLIREAVREEKIRFKNCAIIRIEFSEGISVKIVYPGELECSEAHKESENEYYHTTSEEPDTFIPPDIHDLMSEPGPMDIFRKRQREDRLPVRVGGNFCSKPTQAGPLKRVKLNYVIPAEHCRKIRDKLNIKGNHIFYVVRHGQAKHNEVKYFNLTQDTSVTEGGLEQAFNAGKALFDIMVAANEMPKHLFVSDLKRTRETMNELIHGMHVSLDTSIRMNSPEENSVLRKTGIISKINLLEQQTFIVLPCASEINMIAKNGRCDEKNRNSNSLKKLAFENQTRCTAVDTLDKTHTCYHIKAHRLNWMYYLYFYRGSTRSESGRIPHLRCGDTNMLANVIEYLANKEWHVLPQPVEPHKWSLKSSVFGRHPPAPVITETAETDARKRSQARERERARATAPPPPKTLPTYQWNEVNDPNFLKESTQPPPVLPTYQWNEVIDPNSSKESTQAPAPAATGQNPQYLYQIGPNGGVFRRLNPLSQSTQAPPVLPTYQSNEVIDPKFFKESTQAPPPKGSIFSFFGKKKAGTRKKRRSTTITKKIGRSKNPTVKLTR